MQRRWMPWAIILVVLTVSAFSSPARVTLQPENCSGCGEGDDGSGTIAHRFMGGIYLQGAPNAIHTNWQAGYCLNWHYWCSGAQNARNAVTEALALQDQALLRAVVDRYPGELTYDPVRSVIQVKCPFAEGSETIAVDPLDSGNAS